MIYITPEVFIDKTEMKFHFVRSSGPGGQNINKVATGVQLRFDAAGSKTLPLYVKERLYLSAGNRISGDGILQINSSRYRTQGKNRADAVEKLVKILKKASVRPKRRICTKPSRQSKEKRLESKKRKGRIKEMRRPVNFSD